MYPTDYGYATSGKSKSNRAFCLNTNLSSWNSYSDCYNNDWLYKNGALWTITPYASSSHASNAFYVFNDGSVSGYNVISATYSVYPAVYLSSNVLFSSGTGSIDNPFIPSL